MPARDRRGPGDHGRGARERARRRTRPALPRAGDQDPGRAPRPDRGAGDDDAPRLPRLPQPPGAVVGLPERTVPAAREQARARAHPALALQRGRLRDRARCLRAQGSRGRRAGGEPVRRDRGVACAHAVRELAGVRFLARVPRERHAHARRGPRDDRAQGAARGCRTTRPARGARPHARELRLGVRSRSVRRASPAGRAAALLPGVPRRPDDHALSRRADSAEPVPASDRARRGSTRTSRYGATGTR